MEGGGERGGEVVGRSPGRRCGWVEENREFWQSRGSSPREIFVVLYVRQDGGRKTQMGDLCSTNRGRERENVVRGVNLGVHVGHVDWPV